MCWCGVYQQTSQHKYVVCVDCPWIMTDNKKPLKLIAKGVLSLPWKVVEHYMAP